MASPPHLVRTTIRWIIDSKSCHSGHVKYFFYVFIHDWLRGGLLSLIIDDFIMGVVGTQYPPHCYYGSVSWAPTIAHGKAPHIHYLVHKIFCVIHLIIAQAWNMWWHCFASLTFKYYLGYAYWMLVEDSRLVRCKWSMDFLLSSVVTSRCNVFNRLFVDTFKWIHTRCSCISLVAPLGLSLVVGCEYLLPDLLFLLLWVCTYRCCITLQMRRERWMEAVCPNILVLPLISIILATLHLNSKPGTDLYIKAPNCLWHGCDILFCDHEHHLNVLETNTLWRWICFTRGFSSGLWSFLCSQTKYFVHRIFELSGFPEFLFENWNLITLTLSC